MDALKMALWLDLPTCMRSMAVVSLGLMSLTIVVIALVWLFSGTAKIMDLCFPFSLLAAWAIIADHIILTPTVPWLLTYSGLFYLL